ncbi:MAG: hypothetical protein AB7K08_05340 [Microbacteriaceae bacterium]
MNDRNRVLALIGLEVERPQLSKHDLKLLTADEIALAASQGQFRDVLAERDDPETTASRRSITFDAAQHPQFAQ